MIESGQIRRAILVAGENGAFGWQTIEILNGGNHDRKSIKPFFANLTIGLVQLPGRLPTGILFLTISQLSVPGLRNRHLTQFVRRDVSEDKVMQTDSEDFHAGISVAKRRGSVPQVMFGAKTRSSSLLSSGKATSFNTEALSVTPAQLPPFKLLKLWIGLAYTLACGIAGLKEYHFVDGSGLSSLMLSLNL